MSKIRSVVSGSLGKPKKEGKGRQVAYWIILFVVWIILFVVVITAIIVLIKSSGSDQLEPANEAPVVAGEPIVVPEVEVPAVVVPVVEVPVVVFPVVEGPVVDDEPIVPATE